MPGLVLLPLLAVAACAPQRDAVSTAPRAVAFRCVAEKAVATPPPWRRGATPAATPAAAETIAITFDAQNRPITLNIGMPVLDNYVLEPLPGTADLFSAGDSYGWRGGPSGGVLTEVPTASQRRCQPVSPIIS